MAMAFSLQAAGTDSGVIITNKVTATYSNASSGGTIYNKTNTVINTVQPVFGLSGFSTTTTNFPSPGATVTFAFAVTNKGNGPVVVNLQNLFSRTNDLIHNGTWAQAFYTNSTLSGVTVTELALAEDASRVFYLALTAPGGAQDGAAVTNKFGTVLTNANSPLSPISFYTSWNGTSLFGGFASLTNNIAVAIVRAPKLILTKTSMVTNSASFMALVVAGHERDTVPGSTIIYSITWTNAGSGQLFGLTLNDAHPADVDYVADSVVYGDAGQLPASGANYASLASVLDGAGPVGVFGLTRVVNAGAVVVQYANPITANASGTVMYKVIVK
jgi:uncharacterized repeat protein (TIGR01451 family)